ncbi:MAG: MgtC/SapB family protein [Coprobacillus sp.]|nr:MgtC/SapB family protein [Coprobacillus sp.]
MNNFITLLDDTASGAFETPEGLDSIIVNFFNDLGWWGNLILIFLSLILATIFGGIIGLQREMNGHSAGFRTHVLISLACALIMVISIYGISLTADRDPMRLAAAGVTGAGFLGAGCIIKNGATIKGLTTSATIWLVTAIGLCCGAGMFTIALITTIISMIVLVLFNRVDDWAGRRNNHVVVLASLEQPVLNDILSYLEKYHITYRELDSNFTEHNGEKVIRVQFTCVGKQRAELEKFVEDFKEEVKPIDISLMK